MKSVTAIESSNLTSIGYDTETSIMEITFKNGSTYQYFEVPQANVDIMIKAESVGKAFNKWKKDFPETLCVNAGKINLHRAIMLMKQKGNCNDILAELGVVG